MPSTSLKLPRIYFLYQSLPRSHSIHQNGPSIPWKPPSPLTNPSKHEEPLKLVTAGCQKCRRKQRSRCAVGSRGRQRDGGPWQRRRTEGMAAAGQTASPHPRAWERGTPSSPPVLPRHAHILINNRRRRWWMALRDELQSTAWCRPEKAIFSQKPSRCFLFFFCFILPGLEIRGTPSICLLRWSYLNCLLFSVGWCCAPGSNEGCSWCSGSTACATKQGAASLKCTCGCYWGVLPFNTHKYCSIGKMKLFKPNSHVTASRYLHLWLLIFSRVGGDQEKK